MVSNEMWNTGIIVGVRLHVRFVFITVDNISISVMSSATLTPGVVFGLIKTVLLH